MNNNIHIFVEKGEDAGKQFTIPREGARIGRSSKNDIVIVDPLLSRHHCRMFFKDDGLWVADLGSANETLLNEEPITEAPIYRDNRITIGNTVIQVMNDERASNPAAPHQTPVDLGLDAPTTATAAKRIGLAPLLTVLFVVTAAVIGAYMLKAMNSKPTPVVTIPTAVVEVDKSLSLAYEKVEASSDNIFYYQLTITTDGKLAISIDDLQNNRSIRKEKQVSEELIDGLVETLQNSGFFDLNTDYEGVDPAILEQRVITITIGKDSHTVRIMNRAEPEAFTRVREKLEHFGRIELGIWAIQFSTEKLLSLANDAHLLGKKLDAERLISLGNLSGAIRSFKESEWYLETVEVKPDYYTEMLEARSECEAALAKRYEEQNFQAERAMRLREWAAAAEELRALLDIIPDREDTRHIETRKKLVEVEARVELLK
jgi:hypothetical protein